ncbi:MAG: DUF983 domain-containing protein [Planctomycetaceae bacterium]
MARLELGPVWGRALRLRCPRCGGGKLFRGWLSMYESCPNCKLKYERAPGYFLGSTYINYGLTVGTVTVAYVSLHFGFDYDNRTLVWPLVAFVVLFPLFFFRYARALWLAMDCVFDQDG